MGTKSVQKRAEDALSLLGEYIAQHQNDIVRFWVNMVDRPSSRHQLTYQQLADCVPQICAELSAHLKQASETDTPAVPSGATGHGHERWKQGYSLETIILEMQMLRESFLHRWLPRFMEGRRISAASLRIADYRILRFFDNVIVEAVVQFAVEQRRLQSETEAKLKHSIEQLRAVITAIKHHETVTRHDINTVTHAIEHGLLAINLLGLPDVELQLRIAQIQSDDCSKPSGLNPAITP